MNQDPELTIILLGRSGVGKSASGNTILGRSAFESKMSFQTVTTEISEQRGNVCGKQISVVDTPGILDKNASKGIKKFCQDLLQSSRCCLFLVVLKVERFTKENEKAVKAAMTVLGPSGMKKSYLLFTGRDTLNGMSLDDFIFEGDSKAQLPEFITRFAGAYHSFDNNDSDEEQVRNLLQKSGHLRTKGPPKSPADVSNARRIVLLGRPGVGKSSTGNTILGRKKFRGGCDFNPVSCDTISEPATVEGRQVTVVDTPGFTAKNMSPDKLYCELKKPIVMVNPGPHAFVIVVRIGRIGQDDIKLFEVLPRLFEGGASKYSIVLFTHGDELEGRSIGDLINSNTHVEKLVSMCQGRYCVFDNKSNRNREQVRNLLMLIDQIVIDNGGHYTDDMFMMVEKLKQEHRNLSGETGQSCLSGEKIWGKVRRFLGTHDITWLYIALGVAVVGGILGAASVCCVAGAASAGAITTGAVVGSVVGGVVGGVFGQT